MFSKLQDANVSVNFGKCIYAASEQEEFLGIVIDSTGVRPWPNKMEAIAEMPRHRNVEELRAFLSMTGHLRRHIERYSVVAAPLTGVLRKKTFASKRARKLPIDWGEEQEKAFVRLEGALLSPLVHTFPSWDHGRLVDFRLPDRNTTSVHMNSATLCHRTHCGLVSAQNQQPA